MDHSTEFSIWNHFYSLDGDSRAQRQYVEDLLDLAMAVERRQRTGAIPGQRAMAV